MKACKRWFVFDRIRFLSVSSFEIIWKLCSWNIIGFETCRIYPVVWIRAFYSMQLSHRRLQSRDIISCWHIKRACRNLESTIVQMLDSRRGLLETLWSERLIDFLQHKFWLLWLLILRNLCQSFWTSFAIFWCQQTSSTLQMNF